MKNGVVETERTQFQVHENSPKRPHPFKVPETGFLGTWIATDTPKKRFNFGKFVL